MRAFILRRILILMPTFLGITLVVFTTMKLIPGDPIIALLQDQYTEELAAELRAKLGLDRPIPMPCSAGTCSAASFMEAGFPYILQFSFFNEI